MMRDANDHLNAMTLQALLDGDLTGEAMRSAREHVAGCTFCQAQMESWQTVFACLDQMQHVAAPTGFSGRVMERWHSEASALEAVAAAHLAPDLIQSLLDGDLSPQEARRAEAHLAACSACGEEGRAWRGLLERLDGLGHLDPPRAFAARTMRRVRRSNRVGVRSRAARVARRILPATRKGWAAVAGIATAPATVAAAVVWVLFSNPLVTPSAIGSFARWKLADALGGLGGGALDLVGQSLAAFQAFQVVDLVSSSPALAGFSVLAFSGLTLSALWVLYRNLFSNQKPTYARASI